MTTEHLPEVAMSLDMIEAPAGDCIAVWNFERDRADLPPHSLFICDLVVMIAKENRAVWEDRAQLLETRRRLVRPAVASSQDADFLKTLFEKYGLEFDMSPQALDGLQVRVDVVPFSLLLAQAITESGWGESRIAKRANNLFGRTAVKGQTPCLMQLGSKKYCYKKYANWEESVKDQIRYWNTSEAAPFLESFRRARAKLRRNGASIDTTHLFSSAEGYAEIGADYITKLKNALRGSLNLRRFVLSEKRLEKERLRRRLEVEKANEEECLARERRQKEIERDIENFIRGLIEYQTSREVELPQSPDQEDEAVHLFIDPKFGVFHFQKYPLVKRPQEN